MAKAGIIGIGEQRALSALMRPLEVFRYRELLTVLVIRELKLRYRNSVLGFLWSLLNPLLMAGVFLVVFGVMMPNNNIAHFPAFLLAGILPWNWLATSVSSAVNTLESNASLIKKVYFPPEILPASAVLSNMINFLLALVVFFGLFFALGLTLKPTVVLLPLVVLTQLVFLLGIGMFLSALNVSFRDTGVIMEVLLLAWFFVTPIFYDIRQLFPQYERLLYLVNPAASLVSTYRLILLDGVWPDLLFVGRTVGTCVVVFLIGFTFFLRRARMFGEEL